MPCCYPQSSCGISPTSGGAHPVPSLLLNLLCGNFRVCHPGLWDFGATFSHNSRILKLGLKCSSFHKKSCTKYDWERKCTPNGRHRRSQTKSSFGDDSRQFCVDPNGNRIFGDSSNQDSEIQCRCSRKVWELNQQNRPEQDVMLHCQGTYIPIFVNVKNSFIWSS